MNTLNEVNRRRNFPTSNSIIGRLLIANLILLPLFCGALGLSLDKAFSDSLKSNEQAQLLLHAYALIASAELIDDELWLPNQLSEDKFNQVSSGLSAFVYSNNANKIIWASPSAKNSTIAQSWTPQFLASGRSIFTEPEINEETLFFLQYSVTWENLHQENQTFQIGIFNSQQSYHEQIYIYQKTLWGWLGAITFSMIVLQILILKWGLKPINIVANDLRDIQTGHTEKLTGKYPVELTDMTSSINTLLSTEAEQRLRYKESLSNLAHSLKTPLAIMQGCLYELGHRDNKHKESDSNDFNLNDKSSAENELSEQINRIDQIISYQLKRSVASPKNPFANVINIREQCKKVVTALNKVYRENITVCDINIEADVTFRGDVDDLLEVLGNILDNAFKYGKGHILISASQLSNDKVKIIFEDNGNGVSEALKNKVLQRGERADTSQKGQGIGLATVTDIVSHYGGSLALDKSSFGGLAVIIEF